MISPALIKAAIVAGAVVVGFGGGWAVNGWRLGTKVESLKAEHLQTVADAATAAGLQLAAVTAERDALAGKLSTIDADGSAELKKARNENETLRRGVAGGRVGLRVAATCPTANPAPAGQTEGGRVDSGTTAALTPAAEQDYFALRQGIVNTEATLTACQRSLGAFTGQTVPTP